jgi:hypothetical protein
MEKGDKIYLENYVRINYEFETADEMANNLGIEPMKVRNILTKFELRALKPSNRKLPVQKTSAQTVEKDKPSWSESLREAEGFEQLLAYEREANKSKVVRAPGVYNNIGSPYGISDELRGLKLKR